MSDDSPRLRGHVVMLVENLPVPLDRRVWQEARALHAAGLRVTVIGPCGADAAASKRDLIDGIHVLRYRQTAATGFWGYFREYAPSLVATRVLMQRAHRESPVTVVHFANPPDLLFLVARSARKWGAKIVYDQHDANPELVLTKWGARRRSRRILHRLARALELASYRSADLVVTPNQSYAELANNRGGVPAERIAVVHNAPSRSGVTPLARPGYDHRDPAELRLGYLGVMGSQDGVELLIRAIPEVSALLPGHRVSLHLVGDGETRLYLERLSLSLGLGQSVTFHGYKPAEQFGDILGRCDIAICPDPPTPFNLVSTMTKIADYLALGLAIVGYDLPETRRIAGPAALLVTEVTPAGIARAVRDLTRNPERLQEMRAEARRRLQVVDMSWERSAESLIAGYRMMMSEHSRGPMQA